MIKLRNFFKSFGPKNVLRSLDLDVESGEIVTIRGKNGSGKTTLLKALSTLEKPDDYDLAEIDGFDLVRNSEEVRARVGFLSHNPPYYPELTGLENLDFWLDLHPGNYDSNYSGELLAQVGLIMFKDDMAGNYSRGMIQRLGFAIAIAHSPTTLLLDEPLTGLDEDGSQIIEDHLLRLKDNGCSILLSSHDEISFADRVLELEDGALKMNPILVLLKKELRVEFRTLQGIVPAALLSFMILMSLKFSVMESVVVEKSGILWVSILITGLGLITHTATREIERRTIETLKLAPISRYQLFLGRTFGSMILLWILSSIVFLLFIVLFENVFGDEWLLAYVVVLVGGIGIAAVGNLAASSMTPMYGGWMLTSLFSIPILLFTVIEAGIKCTDSLITDSSDFQIALTLLFLYNLVFVTGGAWLSEISE